MRGNYGEEGHGCHSKEEKFEGRKLIKIMKIICHRKTYEHESIQMQ